MIRLFTLRIRFRKKEYVALVSLRRQANELYCLVRYIDKGLNYLLPGDHLVLSLDGTLKSPHHFPDELSQNLRHCTAYAATTYLIGVNG
jgi:hypothetical protein